MGSPPSTHLHRNGVGSPPPRSAPRLTALTPPANADTYTGTEWAQVPCAHLHREMNGLAPPASATPEWVWGFFVCCVLQPPQRMTRRWRCARAHTHTPSHTQTCTHIHTHTHTNKHAHTHTRTHAHWHAHRQTRTHAHTWPHFKWDRRTAGGYFRGIIRMRGTCRLSCNCAVWRFWLAPKTRQLASQAISLRFLPTRTTVFGAKQPS